MAENIESHPDLGKLALLVDGLEALYKDSNIHIVIELDKNKYVELYNQFVGDEFDGEMKSQFGFDIAKVKFVYFLNE